MNSYFSVELCLGPFPNLNEQTLCQVIDDLVESYGLTKFSSLWEEFSFGEELFEEAANTIGETNIPFEENESWVKAVRQGIKSYLLTAAEAIYLEDDSESTQRLIDGKSWIISGGQTWDGYTTRAAEYIRLIRWSGLDQVLAQTNKDRNED